MSLLKNSHKILGMNARNLKYIRTANRKKSVKLANNKIKSKQALMQAKLPVADLFGVIKNREELLTFNWPSLPNSFVLKPNHGLGGEGILVIFGKKNNGPWITSNDTNIYVKDLLGHTSNILDGNFSLSGIPDIAFFEERLKLHPDFKKISYQGIPDIRILIFNSVPVMAMLRLPTQESHGKANLHQGGIGLGIDLATGTTTFATQNDQLITQHPDTHSALKNFSIPGWDNILKIAVQAQQTIGLGFSGVDIVIDRDKGPVILEINGHPGLSIQNANLTPLKDRLDRIAGLEINSAIKGIKVAKQLFAKKTKNLDNKNKNNPETTIEEDKDVLGFIETVDLILNKNKPEKIRAKIDTGIISTTISRQLAIKIGLQSAIENFDALINNKEKFPAAYIKDIEKQLNQKNIPDVTGVASIIGVKNGDKYILRPKIKLEFILKNQTISTEVVISRDKDISYPMIIGRQDLKNFLVDPTKSLTNK